MSKKKSGHLQLIFSQLITDIFEKSGNTPLNYKQVAGRLNISTRTVESYRVQIMSKMQAESVAILVRQAIRLNVISP